MYTSSDIFPYNLTPVTNNELTPLNISPIAWMYSEPEEYWFLNIINITFLSRFSEINIYIYGALIFLIAYIVYLVMNLVNEFKFNPLTAKVSNYDYDKNGKYDPNLFSNVKKIIESRSIESYDHTYDISHHPIHGRVIAEMDGKEYIPVEKRKIKYDPGRVLGFMGFSVDKIE